MVKLSMKMIGAAQAVSTMRRLKPTPTKASYVVGPSANYGGHVEYGTSRMSAQPYMRPAAREAKGNVKRHVRSANNLDAAMQSIAYEIEAGGKQRCPVATGFLRGSIAVRKG